MQLRDAYAQANGGQQLAGWASGSTALEAVQMQIGKLKIHSNEKEARFLCRSDAFEGQSGHGECPNSHQ
jgi:hypothetical protein